MCGRLTVGASNAGEREGQPSVMLIPPPHLGEELWARVRRYWRKGRVVAINRKTLRPALARSMPERPLAKEITVGRAYVATEDKLQWDQLADDVAPEWLALDRQQGGG